MRFYPPPIRKFTLPNGDTITSVRKDIMEAALRPRRPRPKRGDKVMFHISPKHVASAIVSRVDGGYVYIVRKTGRHTYLQELLDSEIVHIISSGHEVPISDQERELAEHRRKLHRRLAMRLAAVYHGRPVDEAYVFGEATGGAIFGAMATAALEEFDR